MICINCNQRKICNIFKLKQEHVGEVDINITNCTYSSSKNVATIQSKEEEKCFSFEDDFDVEEYNKLVQVETVKEEKVMITCTTCGGTDYAEYLKFCSKCGKETCGNCATSENGLIFCSECWEEI